ncbi:MULTISPECIES: beta-ketoacyl-ACP synthase III [Marinilabiliaceae]|uniref:Beta-ketoacyl-[acyl-carrier-protein] synthase III n=1 Tax=Plebeiibacterium marinum TaxID=2992111 RepID=A0AAE3MF51_9BACT|nr:beta-ketoacyl-ACP synthase III [Plebeiobacterium marinum]MCU4164348.1 ketoacyl-ACP synthase III [Marinilabiliaceae bacterium A049]MCW3806698.1 ketoacyl-ACP synthase III [Plebeiobacterium marinum]
MITAKISGIEAYLPDYKLTNEKLSEMVDTSDEWITKRVGIKERRILKGEGLATSDMGAEAVKKLLQKTNTSAEEIDLIITATVTPDMFFPSTSCLIADKAGIKNAWGFDISAACSGFLFSLQTASQFIETGKHKKVVLVAADKMSSITDYTDRTTCVLFGDAAVAMLLEPTEEKTGVLDHDLHIDGSGKDFLYMKAGGSLRPASHETVDAKEHFIYQEGKSVFKVAVTSMADTSVGMMKKHNISAEELAWFVPHQANLRIIEAVGKRMGLTKDKIKINIERYGNTTAATIPLCLWELEKDLKKGDKLILSAFGGGFTWGSIYLKWAYDN